MFFQQNSPIRRQADKLQARLSLTKAPSKSMTIQIQSLDESIKDLLHSAEELIKFISGNYLNKNRNNSFPH